GRSQGRRPGGDRGANRRRDPWADGFGVPRSERERRRASAIAPYRPGGDEIRRRRRGRRRWAPCRRARFSALLRTVENLAVARPRPRRPERLRLLRGRALPLRRRAVGVGDLVGEGGDEIGVLVGFG